ncbi:unnamed protein product, partial [Mesorhabditis spiculigera]
MVKRDKSVARPKGRTIVVGDLHGNFNDLWRIIHAWLSDVVDGGPGQNIMFLGDIVDRGPRQLECLILIMAYKMHDPQQVFIVRGNHEEHQVSPFLSQDEKNDRVRRQDDIPEKIQYPRCINVAELADEDQQRVKGDQFLNCETNIFVQFRNGNTSGLAIDPPPCEGANDTKICTHRHGVPTETTPIPLATTAAALSTERLIGIGAGVGGILLLTTAPSEIVDLAEGQYKLITTNLDGGLMEHLEKMTEGKQRALERQAGRYDLAKHGFALRVDLEKLKAWKSKQQQPDEPEKKTNFVLEEVPRSFAGLTERLRAKFSSPDCLFADKEKPYYNPDADDIWCLCDGVLRFLRREKGVARPKGRTIVVGDLDGNLSELWRIIHAWLLDVVDGGPGQNIIFLGNIIGGRGNHQLECLLMILTYKALYPFQVFIVRGNHEDNDDYTTFQADVIKRGLPVVGLIDGRILCMHGMISMELTKEMLQVGWDPKLKAYDTMSKHLRWNDPSEKVEFYEPNPTRKHGMFWGPKGIKEAMDRLDVEFVLRSHQMMTNGVRRFANMPVATVFISSFHGDKKTLGAVLSSIRSKWYRADLHRQYGRQDRNARGIRREAA